MNCVRQVASLQFKNGQDPIHYRQERGDWVLTRYADIVAVLQNSNFAHSERLLETPPNPNQEPVSRFLHLRQESQNLAKLWLVLRNPPDNTRLRQLLHGIFTPQKVQALRPRIQAIVDNLIERVKETNSMDIIHDLAHPLSVRVSCEVVGIPQEEEHPRFKQWFHELSLALDIDVPPINNERGWLVFAN